MGNHSFNVLVTDFDGTMTQNDFYELVVEKLLPPDVPDHWHDYRTKRINHFEALRNYFAEIRADDATVLRLIEQMQLDPDLKPAVARLDAAGWKVVVASAGCRWYIDRLLKGAGVALEVHANPGTFVEGSGLVMEQPADSPFFSATHGIDKAGVVRHFLASAAQVAFAGDGYPDVEAAKLVPASLRFARGALAETLSAAGLEFCSYKSWSEIADRLATDRRQT